MTPTARPRAYDSPVRRAKAAASRAAVLKAARESFASHGWNGTSMRNIARAAGVSVETVYAVLGGKVEILKILIDVAIVGDDDPIPLAEREEFQRLALGSRADRIRAAAALSLTMNRRIAPVYRALDQARDTEPDLADLHREHMATRRISLREAVVFINGQDVDDATFTTVDLLTAHHTFDYLTRDRGFDDAAYVSWLESALTRTLS